MCVFAANFGLPAEGDDSPFKEITFVELDREEATKLIEEYNKVNWYNTKYGVCYDRDCNNCKHAGRQRERLRKEPEPEQEEQDARHEQRQGRSRRHEHARLPTHARNDDARKGRTHAHDVSEKTAPPVC